MARVARVNLSHRSVKIGDSECYYQWLGGRGFGARIIFDEVSRETAPLDPANKLIFASGILTGTDMPGSSRTALVTKNVINKGISFSSGGGDFGPALKRSGIDALIIEGRSDKPAFLLVDDGKVEILPAEELWGKTTWDCVDHIRALIGDPGAQIASIGPAGENLVKIACVIIDRAHALAWGGSGAIMGSKNLKAVAVKSVERAVKVNDSERFEREVKRYEWILKSSPAAHALKEGGTHGMAGVGGWSGIVPSAVNNLQEEYWDPEKSKRINQEAYLPFEKGRTNCYNCPLYCLHLYRMEQDGEVLECEGMHANSVRGFGSNWGVDHPFAVLKAHALCNMLGLDVDGVSSAIAWAIECSESGVLSVEETGGVKLTWGDYKTLLPLIEKVAHKSGFGEVLAEGVFSAAKRFGEKSLRCAMHIKQVGLNEQGVRSHKAWAFGMAVSARGGGHLSGSPQVENRQLPANTGKWLFENENAGKPTSYANKGQLVGWYEIYKALVDSLGMCYFTSGWYEVALADINSFVETYNTLLGRKITADELWSRSRYIVNLEKAFNTVHAGFNRSDDTLPSRIMTEPLTVGPYKGELFEAAQMEKMLDEYYIYHDWDPGTGLQKPDKMCELGFTDIAEYLS